MNGLNRVKILQYERNEYGIHEATVEVLDDKLPPKAKYENGFLRAKYNFHRLEELQNSLHEAVKKLVKLLGGPKKYKVYEIQNGEVLKRCYSHIRCACTSRNYWNEGNNSSE